MPKIWQFRSLSFDKTSGRISLTELSPEQMARVGDYEGALIAAECSRVPYPKFSNYNVRTGVGLTNHIKLQAGNVEYGWCQALHGEESAVAAFRSTFGRKLTRRMVLGFIEAEAEKVGRPCGNCRDIMLDLFGPDFEIVSGSEKGGIAVVAKMSDFLFEDFKDVTRLLTAHPHSHFSGMSRAQFEANVSRTLAMGEYLENDIYSPARNLERKYAAMIITPYGTYFGAMDTVCDYHSLYSLRDAMREARRAHDPFVSFVIIVRNESSADEWQQKQPPHVMYKDRQHLLELVLEADLVDPDRHFDPPVYLVTRHNGATVRVWKTSAKEWLPLPFTFHCFGPAFIEKARRYYRTKLGPRERGIPKHSRRR